MELVAARFLTNIKKLVSRQADFSLEQSKWYAKWREVCCKDIDGIKNAGVA